jgi:hypothetical protein
MKSIRRVGLVLGVVAPLLAVGRNAFAQNQIKSPTAHPQYSAELEPHLLFDFVGDDDLGLGGRATFVVMDPGFISALNNNVGVGVGFDWLSGDDHCNPGGCHDHDRLLFPVVMQWNFWFTPQWSAFAEPGLSFVVRDDDHFGRHDDDDLDIDPSFFVGGRFNFNDDIALTLRLGIPASSFGVSFFL